MSIILVYTRNFFYRQLLEKSALKRTLYSRVLHIAHHHTSTLQIGGGGVVRTKCTNSGQKYDRTILTRACILDSCVQWQCDVGQSIGSLNQQDFLAFDVRTCNRCNFASNQRHILLVLTQEIDSYALLKFQGLYQLVKTCMPAGDLEK